MVSNYDLMPTVLSYLGFKDKIPQKPELPGRDYSAALQDRQLKWDNVIFYEFENSRMIRTSDWKYTRRFPDGPDELYDLNNDAGERENLIGRPQHAGIQKKLDRQLDKFFGRYANPKYDLWRGGGAKTYLLTSPQKPLR
jgi:arylsulfatase A-like enzyme